MRLTSVCAYAYMRVGVWVYVHIRGIYWRHLAETVRGLHTGAFDHEGSFDY